MNARQKAILKLIRSEKICNQEELQSALKNLGFPVAQTTISRDIRALGLIKKADENQQYCYQEAEINLNQQELFISNILKIDYAGNMLVIKCNTGTAQAVCTRIDSMNLLNIVGTLAGDDTIFVLVRTQEQARKLAEELIKNFKTGDKKSC
ncbi:MAG: ArgR family transcriptional regulator [Oscillospiraceae bacterium]|nr:ArgR family transcriptional regulator [Oscillospiraceae bacterium]MDE6658119.1 ArgR family transcriptional regulator [Oscillospiraceae bacterium]